MGLKASDFISDNLSLFPPSTTLFVVAVFEWAVTTVQYSK